MSRGRRQVGIEQVNPLIITSALALALSGCGLAVGNDVRAYNGCMVRHSQEAAVCEGPRQAYEVDIPEFQAKSAVTRSTAAAIPD